jgi:hypothetical protein
MATASLIDLWSAFEKEERRREKKQDALELEWLAWDNAQEVLAAEQEAKDLEANEREANERQAERKDPERKEAERKEAERARRSAQVWEGIWAVASARAGGTQRKKK